jgi:hypothetical protein
MLISVAHERRLQLAMKALVQSVGGGMPRSSPTETGTGDGSLSLKKTGLELPALVGCDLLGTTETRNPETKALVTVSAVMSDRGSASGQQVHLSMAVRQYRKPEETGS